MTSTTKAWIHTTPSYPETLRQTTIPVPTTPAPNHLLIEVKASALNPVDIQLMNVALFYLPFLNGQKIAGRDFAGVVLAAGDGTQFRPGDEVMGLHLGLTGNGTLTEIAHLDARSTCIVKKPKHLSWAQAASLPLVWLTAYTSVERCAPFMKAPSASGNKLAVLGGSSATGMYTIRIAKARGWTILSSCSGRNEGFVRGLGADEIVGYTASSSAVKSAVESFRPDAIVDCVSGTDCIGLAPQYVTIVGDKTDRSLMGGNVLLLTRPRMTLRWLLGYLGIGNSYECINLEQNPEFLRRATELKGEEVVIDSVFRFDKTKEAFERLNTGRARGKVIVEVSK
ncbi:alcohol dehydrogenase [Xylaria arbuscula]|nr:alcohol dehydrogenase [Xylaria arbuscula]